MKVKELIDILENIDEELEVRVIDTSDGIEEAGVEIEDVVEIIQHNSKEAVFSVFLRTK